jgi:translation initiation factor 1
MANGAKVSTDGGGGLAHNPFGSLGRLDLPNKETSAAVSHEPASKSSTFPSRNRGRVDIKRTTGGRGGKTVTVISGFVGIGLPEKEKLAKQMRASCGCGGTVKDGNIEIQGDQREKIATILTQAGFRPVFAGG